jgi:hypothetical protein
MGRFEVQGVVSAQTGEPLVQLRQLDDEDVEMVGFQVSPGEAREIAQNIQEAATNAVYDAALINWAKESDNEQMGVMLVDIVRRYRADRWGLPDRPEDWRPKEEDG